MYYERLILLESFWKFKERLKKEKLVITTITLEEAITNAEKIKACKEDLDTIKSLGSIEAVLKHKKAAYWLYWYARDVIKDRWPEAEEYIKKDSVWAYCYAREIIKDRWLEAEKYIMKDPKHAYWYAENVIKDRWPETEEYIKKDPEWAYWYAHNIIKNRWPEAEEYIMKAPEWTYCYARNIIKDRWPEAEKYIMKIQNGHINMLITLSKIDGLKLKSIL